MLYEVEMKHRFPLGEKVLNFQVYAKKNDRDMQALGLECEDVAVQLAFQQFFMSGNALYENNSIEITRIEEIDDEAI